MRLRRASCIALGLLMACILPSFTAQAQTDWERDGLIGPVRRIRTELASRSGGSASESPRALYSVEVFDQNGRKKQMILYPTKTNPAEQFQQSLSFNDRGDLSEVELQEPGGSSVVERRRFTYEYDPVGNWVQRTMSIRKGPQGEFLPAEVTYRLVIYYLTKELAKAINYEPQDVPVGGGAFFFEPRSKYPPRVFEQMFRVTRLAKLATGARTPGRYIYYRHGSHFHRCLYRNLRCRRRWQSRRGRTKKSRSATKGTAAPAVNASGTAQQGKDWHQPAIASEWRSEQASSFPVQKYLFAGYGLQGHAGLRQAGPEVTAELVKPAANSKKGVALLSIHVIGLQIVDPIEVDEIPKAGEGHVHVQLNDGPILAVPSLHMRLTRIPPGQHVIKVMLHANDHSPIGSGTEVSFLIPRRQRSAALEDRRHPALSRLSRSPGPPL